MDGLGIWKAYGVVVCVALIVSAVLLVAATKMRDEANANSVAVAAVTKLVAGDKITAEQAAAMLCAGDQE